MKESWKELVEGVLGGDTVSLARLITSIENQREGYREALKELHPHTGGSHVIGITGSPGSGKSTLVDGLVDRYREAGHQVGVIAVDPSSPFSGGALLGDRTRLRSRAGDDQVFFRSMSARGMKGGLAAATGDAITALDAAGNDVIIVETVGAGQNEVEIVRTAHTVLVVLTPSSGDDVQMLKAGILEIGDIFVVNKADRQGADRTVMDVRNMIELNRDTKQQLQTRPSGDESRGDPTLEDRFSSWEPTIVETVATLGTGLDELRDQIENHLEFLRETSQLKAREQTRFEHEVVVLLQEGLRKRAWETIQNRGGIEELSRKIARRELGPHEVVEDLLGSLPGSDDSSSVAEESVG